VGAERLPVAFGVALLVAAAAGAQTLPPRLYAVVAGANRGAAEDGPLRYARDDATRVAETLVEVGGVGRDDLVTLHEPTAEGLRGALIGMNDRIRREAPGRGALVVYYSGHADAEALHLGSGRLPSTELEGLVRGSSASFRVLVVDACRSGALTAVKGASPAPSFEVGPAGLASEGFVVLTAAAAGEDAQESDRLRSSFFTHHFLSGLRGAADDDGDRNVTLDEVYGYVFRETVRSSSATLAGTQHPTFRYDLRGRGDVVLARLGGADTAWLELPTGTSWLVFDGAGRVMGELGRDGARRTLALPPGRYAVRGRQPASLLDGTVQVVAGRTTRVAEASLTRSEYARLVRKGGDDDAPPIQHAVRAGWSGHGAWLPGTSACSGAFASWVVTQPSYALVPRGHACEGRWSNEAIAAVQSERAVELQAVATFDLPARLSLEVGGFLGGLWVDQRFDAVRATAGGRTFSPTGGLTAGVSMQLPRGLVLAAEAEGRSAVVRSFDGALAVPLVLGGRVGAGLEF
jgi:hypothetical protein